MRASCHIRRDPFEAEKFERYSKPATGGTRVAVVTPRRTLVPAQFSIGALPRSAVCAPTGDLARKNAPKPAETHRRAPRQQKKRSLERLR
ncbi:hypothetical protein PT2222_50252 [Paraburkholderia tropica]